MTPHTQQSFDTDLNHLVALLLEMGELVSRQLASAGDTLDRGDGSPSDLQPSGRERIMALELDISRVSTQIIVRWQPAAVDLRLVMASFKLARGLGQISACTWAIGSSVAKMQRAGDRFPEVRLKPAAAMVATMLGAVLTAYRTMKGEGVSRAVYHRSAQLATELEGRSRELLVTMMAEPGLMPHLLELMFVIRAVEAISCHIREMLRHVERLTAIPSATQP